MDKFSEILNRLHTPQHLLRKGDFYSWECARNWNRHWWPTRYTFLFAFEKSDPGFITNWVLDINQLINLFRNYSTQASLGVVVRWKRLLRCFGQKTDKQTKEHGFSSQQCWDWIWNKIGSTSNSKRFSSTKVSLQGWEDLEEKSKRLANEVEQLEAEVICHL